MENEMVQIQERVSLGESQLKQVKTETDFYLKQVQELDKTIRFLFYSLYSLSSDSSSSSSLLLFSSSSLLFFSSSLLLLSLLLEKYIFSREISFHQFSQ